MIIKEKTQITKNLEGKVVIRIRDDVIDTRVHLRTRDNRWVFVRKGIVLRPMVIDAVLEALRAAREELCGKTDDIRKRR